MFWYILILLTLVLWSIYQLYSWWKHRPWVGDLPNKCVFITGCDSGFGWATAKSLYKRRVPVFAGCLTEEGAHRLREETCDGVDTILIDISETKSIERAYKYVCDKLPTGSVLWGIVNNAGIAGVGGPLEFMTRSDYQSVMEVNCFGAVEVARIFLPLIKKSQGRIINTASMIAESPWPNMLPYVISKFAMKAFSGALRREKIQWGINVSTIEPGEFKTNISNPEIFKAKFTKQWNNLDPAIRKEYGQEYFQSVTSAICKNLEAQTAIDLKPVIEAYEHALFAKEPYALYTPGIDSKIIYYLANYCPSFLLDKIIIKTFSAIKPEALKNRL